MKQNRRIIGVIGAEVNSIEQRQILSGIISQAIGFNTDVAVISNIFNPNSEELWGENKIYDLIESNDFDAIILLSESFVNESLKQLIYEHLKKKQIPVLMVGVRMALLETLFPSINTSDANDIEDLTDHLIEAHGFRDIDIISGFDFLDISRIRVDGYRRSLEKHGITFDEKKVYYGNFWMNSGEELAERYLSGELPLPQAVICANDYMAFGILDKLEHSEITIPDKLTVVGYEFVRERHMHSPILTTYQRNRKDLGKAAVEILLRKLDNLPEIPFHPPQGSLVKGTSCPCSTSEVNMQDELASARMRRNFDMLNLQSQFDQKLSESSTVEEFAAVMGEYHYLVRYVHNIYLCLFDDWYDNSSESISDVLHCRSVVPWKDITASFRINHLHIAELISKSNHPSAYYFNPIFFRSKLFGYAVLQYHKPDTYDDIYRNWLKSIANGLEFLRMKNDVRYLVQCQNFSEEMDSITEIYNKVGLNSAFQMMKGTHPKAEHFPAVFLRVCIDTEDRFSKEYTKARISALMAAARVVKTFSEGRGLCGRMNENSFLFIGQSEDTPAQLLAETFQSLLLSDEAYTEHFGMDSFFCIGCSVQRDTSFSDMEEMFLSESESRIRSFYSQRLLPHYTDLLSIRNRIYRDPVHEYSVEDIAKQCMLSVNYLNAKYKECFGISFHRDCINSRIVLAKSLLCTTSMRIINVAEACGYSDSKYFSRQFSAVSGVNPAQYRRMLEYGITK